MKNRISLRPIERADLPTLLQWRNTDDYRTMCRSHVPTVTIDELDHEFAKQFENDLYAQHVAHDYLGQPIGTIWAYRYSSVGKTIYVTTFVAETFRISGYYGAEMFVHFLDFLFNRGIRKVYLEVRSDNPFSARLLSRIGANREACFVDHCVAGSGYCDLYVYAITFEIFFGSKIVQRFITPS